MISIDQIKDLRERTGISVAECKKALEAAGGDMAKALATLAERGAAIAAKKSGRALGAGVVSAYVHTTGAMGALVELLCETDFVAKTGEFKTLADDLAMQVAAFAPDNLELLLTQPFVKKQELTVAEVVKNAIQKFGERIEVGRFSRLAL